MTQKNPVRKSAAILLLAAALLGCMIWNRHIPKQSAATPAEAGAASSKTAMKRIQGVWIAFSDYKNAGLYHKDKKNFTANADAYFKKLKKDGINTVYFHTVPCSDAIYPSRYLPWSSYMFPSEPDYDPLKILVSTAHKYGISFHAWINPYRRTMDVIYDPGREASTTRILRIVKEIIQNYDVDGIHFDDYFYPPRTKSAQFYNVPAAKRKSVISKMIKKVYRTVKNYDKDLLFGISPAGVMDYAESLGCDLKTWLSRDGYIDYIIPQIYWSDQYLLNGKITALFSDRLSQWTAINKNDTPMYIGLGLYRCGTQNPADLGWSRKNNNIVTQIKQLSRQGCEGFVLFRSSYLYDSATQKEVRNYRKYIRSFPSQKRL